MTEQRLARPLQAASASALSFAAGAILPLVAVALTPAGLRVVVCVLMTLLALALLGDLGARLGGAHGWRATPRAVTWGAGAMAITSGIGALVGRPHHIVATATVDRGRTVPPRRQTGNRRQRQRRRRVCDR